MIRRVVRFLLRPLFLRIERRVDAFAVRRYHAKAFRDFRILAANEPDPRISRWFEAQARAHRRFAGPVPDPITIEI